jgi:hypothetical protein
MTAIDARSAASGWLPQRFGKHRARHVTDPIVEPLWAGTRVLAHVDAGGPVALRDADGQAIDDQPEIETALLGAGDAANLVLEGYLTHQPVQDLNVVARRDAIEPPRPAEVMSQWWFGGLGRRRKKLYALEAEALERSRPPAGEMIAFVAVDLLWLDDEPLLDVPLLERKRILESVLRESTLVRRGIYVRPPIDAWLGSWRSLGISRIAFKAANSRYRPGEVNEQWAIASVPLR